MNKLELKKLIAECLKEHEESDMSQPEESREVQIGKEMLALAQELIAMHQPESDGETPSTDTEIPSGDTED